MGFLVFGGLAFWCLLAVAFLIFLIGVENKQGEGQLRGPVVLTLCVAGLLYLSDSKSFIEFFKTLSYGRVAAWFGVYILAGLGWSFFKWVLYLKAQYYYYTKTTYFTTLTTEELKHKKPKAKENKEKISAWIFYWPFSGLRYILGDILYNLGDWLVKTFGGAYDKLADKYFPV